MEEEEEEGGGYTSLDMKSTDRFLFLFLFFLVLCGERKELTLGHEAVFMSMLYRY
jgi:hypothetical protein